MCERWVHDPYFQYVTGEELFQHAFPHERSGLSHWRKRITVDTTVQPKTITFPTDAKLMHKVVVMLVREARKHGVALRQSYVWVASRDLAWRSWERNSHSPWLFTGAGSPER